MKIDKATVLPTIWTGLLAIIGFFFVRTLNSVEGSLERVSNSVDSLNQNMAKVVVELAYQRRDIDLHTKQIDDIKARLPRK